MNTTNTATGVRQTGTHSQLAESGAAPPPTLTAARATPRPLRLHLSEPSAREKRMGGSYPDATKLGAPHSGDRAVENPARDNTCSHARVITMPGATEQKRKKQQKQQSIHEAVTNHFVFAAWLARATRLYGGRYGAAKIQIKHQPENTERTMKHAAFIFALTMALLARLNAAQPEFCVTIIDDVNDPIALAQHGISPTSPESLAGLLDAIANSHHAVTFAYVVVREKADRGVPVTIQIEPFLLTAPKRPDRNLPLAELETAMADYRSNQLKYETAQRRHAEKSSREREAFIRAALDAQEIAEGERDSLKSAKGFVASDIEGTVLAAVGVARTSGASKAILLLNSDLASNRNELFGLVQGRKTASRALTAEELPESLLNSIVCVNTSFKPDSSPFLKATKCEKLHAGNLATATELLRGLLDKRGGTAPTALASSNPN